MSRARRRAGSLGFFFSSRRRHTRYIGGWSSDVCSSDLDLDAWVNLFIPDVDCGSYGKGREALKRFIEPAVRTFYRSIHQICGHVIELIDSDHAKGTEIGRASCRDRVECGAADGRWWEGN